MDNTRTPDNIHSASSPSAISSLAWGWEGGEVDDVSVLPHDIYTYRRRAKWKETCKTDLLFSPYSDRHVRPGLRHSGLLLPPQTTVPESDENEAPLDLFVAKRPAATEVVDERREHARLSLAGLTLDPDRLFDGRERDGDACGEDPRHKGRQMRFESDPERRALTSRSRRDLGRDEAL